MTAPPTTTTTTPGDLAAFLALLWRDGDVREVRIPKYDGRRTASGYFDDPLRLAEAVREWDGRANLYVTLNPTDPALLARADNRINQSANSTTADADIVERRWLLVDIDPTRPSGISATDKESGYALDIARQVSMHLTGLGWPDPVVAMSGNGYALLYRISLPNDAASMALVSGVLAYLAAMFNDEHVVIDTTVSNAGRIGCLVGTQKVKGDATADRPHRYARLVKAPAAPEPVPVGLLAALAPSANGHSTTTGGDSGVRSGWVRERLDAVGIPVRRENVDAAGITWYILTDCPFHPGEGSSDDCGVGEAPDGKAAGHCFHARGAGAGWREFRAKLGLDAATRLSATGDRGPAAVPAKVETDSLRWYSPRELAELASPDPDWLVGPGLLAVGAITEIDGKIKAAGKTTLILWMVRAVLDGAPFLGTLTRQARVLYVTEQSRQTFVYALREAGLADRGDELRILFREDFRGAPWPAIVATARQDGYDIVIFDTIGKLAGIREENSAGEWAVALTPLQDLAASGRAVIVARHDRKGGGEVGDSGRGSSQASGDVDIILALRRPEGNQPSNRRVIESLSRFRETPEKLVVELRVDGYQFLGSEEAVAAAEATAFVSFAIGSEYRTNGIGPDLSELAGLAAKHDPPIKRTSVTVALTGLFEKGEAQRSGAGKKGDPFRYQPKNADSFRTQTLGNERINETETDLRDAALRIFSDES